MTKLILILMLVAAMMISFAAIATVMLFATGTVRTMDEVRALVTGEMATRRDSLMAGEVMRIQDAMMRLQQHKYSLEREILTLADRKRDLERVVEMLGAEIDRLGAKDVTEDADQTQLRAQQRAQVVAWFNTMPVAQAAAIVDNLSDETALWLLPKLDARQAAQILGGLANAQRKVDLTQKAIQGSSP